METITPKEAARRCNVSTRTIRAWLQAKKITRYAGPNGYSVLIDAAELAAYNELRRRGPDPVVVDQLAMHGEPVMADTCRPEEGYHSTPHRRCILRGAHSHDVAVLTEIEQVADIPAFKVEYENAPVPAEPVRCIHGRELADCPRCGPK